MKIKLAPLLNADSLLDVSPFSEFDIQVREQFFPLTQGLYHQSLLVEESPQIYLQQYYGVGTDDIQNYQLGYCNRQLGKQLPHHRSHDGVKLRGALSHLKILRPSGHESFRGCITVPVYYEGEIVAYYGERIDRARRGSSASYWHPIEKPAIFNIDHIENIPCVFMCQSPLVAIQMMDAFSGKVIATDAFYNLCDEDLKCLTDKGIQSVIAVKHSNVDRLILMKLAKRLSRFGIQYESIIHAHGGSYGRA